MNRKNILILASILLLGNLACYAQLKSVDYEKAVDLLNCRAIELSLKSAEVTDYENFSKSLKCTDNPSYLSLNKYLSSLMKYQNTIDLAAEIESLKGKFDEKKAPGDALDFLTKEVFQESSKFKRLAKFEQSRKEQPEYQDFKANLKRDLDRILSYQEIIVSDTKGQDVGANKEKKDEETGLSYFSLYFLVPFSLALAACGFSVWFFFRVNSAFQDVDDQLKQPPRPFIPAKSSYDPETENLRSQLNQLTLEFNRLKTSFEEFTSGSNRLEGNKDNVSADYSNYQKPKIENSLSSFGGSDIYYLPTPNDDGSFNAKSLNPNFIEGSSIYKFEKKSKCEASFEIDQSSAAMKQALLYPETNITRVCIADNSFEAFHTRVRTVSPGKAVLEGDKWKVIDKAQIRYE